MIDNILENKFSDKYNVLPDEVKFFLSSELSGQAIIALADEYKLERDEVYRLVFLTVNSNFDFKFLEERIKKLNLTGIGLKNFWIDFLGRLWLPVADYLEKYSDGKINIDLELIKVGGKRELYHDFVEKLADEIIEENIKAIEEEAEEYKQRFNIQEESEYIFNILSNNVISIFNLKSLVAARALNRSFIYLLFNEKSFKEEALRKIMNNNNELIGGEKIIIDDKKLEPTISAWLKDFIKKNGSILFDDLLLVQYLSNSENVKNLSYTEKENLGNVIRLYKNIAFFPESFNDIPPHKWQIFTFDTGEYLEEESSSRKNYTKAIPSEVIKEESGDSNDILSDDNNFKPEYNQNNEELQKLKDMMSSFPPASLERKAIKEEIKRLEKKLIV